MIISKTTILLCATAFFILTFYFIVLENSCEDGPSCDGMFSVHEQFMIPLPKGSP